MEKWDEEFTWGENLLVPVPVHISPHVLSSGEMDEEFCSVEWRLLKEKENPAWFYGSCQMIHNLISGNMTLSLRTWILSYIFK